MEEFIDNAKVIMGTLGHKLFEPITKTADTSQSAEGIGGVGSTAKACALSGRVCTSIELEKKWHDELKMSDKSCII